MALGLAAAVVVALVLASGSGDDQGDQRAAQPTEQAKRTQEPAASGAQQEETPAPTETAAPEQTTAPAAAGGDPAEAVQAWYAAMAQQDMDELCSMMGPALKARYSCEDFRFETLEEVVFEQAEVTDSTEDSATVAVRTVARHTDRTERCSGTVGLVRGAEGWLIDALNVSCV
jgi:hypothetical protein